MARDYVITVPFPSSGPSDADEKFHFFKPFFCHSLVRAAKRLPKDHASVLMVLAERAKRSRSLDGLDRIYNDLRDFCRQEHIKIKREGIPFGPREWSPRIKGIEDLPLPENTPRPEMWTAESVVQAVKDGFTFLILFLHWKGYWIGGKQYDATGLTVGPEHTPEIRLLDDGWIQAKTYFRPEMVPERTWLTPPNEHGVVSVYMEIDPDTIDWDNLNRGHQIRVPGGML